MKTRKIDTALRWRGLLILTVAAALAAAPALAQGPAAKRPAAAKPVVATAKAQPAAKGAGGPQEGIKVHGHWVIEVRNPDGTLADRREFDNRLVDASLIPRILARKAQNLGLLVAVGSVAVTPNSVCLAMAEADFPSLPGISKTLTVTAPTGPQAGQLILFGGITANVGCTVSKVGTLVLTNTSQIPPLEVLTEAAVPQGPINVAQGQVFTISVTLTFS